MWGCEDVRMWVMWEYENWANRQDKNNHGNHVSQKNHGSDKRKISYLCSEILVKIIIV